MKFTELGLPGVWLIEPTAFDDDRGSFWRDFCADEYAEHGLSPMVAQGNVSQNTRRGTLRGFHYQAGPFGEAKTLACITGSLYDIVVDLRKGSPTFLKWISLEISAADHKSLYVPVGCANAWMSTAPDTTLHYYMSERFVPDSYRGIRYNDPAFGFRWPSEPVVMSEKDRTHPDFTPASLDEA